MIRANMLIWNEVQHTRVYVNMALMLPVHAYAAIINLT